MWRWCLLPIFLLPALVAAVGLFGRTEPITGHLFGLARAPSLFLVALAVPLAAWRLRRRRAGRWAWVVLALSATTGLAHGADAAIERAARAVLAPREGAQARPLKVMTWNVHFSGRGAKEIYALIEREDPDLLLLQEVTPKWQARLTTRYRDRYPHQLYRAQRGAYGYATLARYPLRDEALLRDASNPFALCHLVDVEGSEVAMCNAHLKSSRSAFESQRGLQRSLRRSLRENHARRSVQLEETRRWLHPRSASRILAGDLNTPPFDPLYRELVRGFVDAFRASSSWPGCTYPNRASPREAVARRMPDMPFMRLDYVLVSGAWRIESSRAPSAGGSDHLPVVAELDLRTGR